MAHNDNLGKIFLKNKFNIQEYKQDVADIVRQIHQQECIISSLLIKSAKQKQKAIIDAKDLLKTYTERYKNFTGSSYYLGNSDAKLKPSPSPVNPEYQSVVLSIGSSNEKSNKLSYIEDTTISKLNKLDTFDIADREPNFNLLGCRCLRCKNPLEVEIRHKRTEEELKKRAELNKQKALEFERKQEEIQKKIEESENRKRLEYERKQKKGKEFLNKQFKVKEGEQRIRREEAERRRLDFEKRVRQRKLLEKLECDRLDNEKRKLIGAEKKSKEAKEKLMFLAFIFMLIFGFIFSLKTVY